MSGDSLFRGGEGVSVVDDQTQHLVLARDVANRFNTRYGKTFVVPKAINPAFASRVMDLADPTGKMGKTTGSDLGMIYLLDGPDIVARKVARAVTDPHGQVLYDPRRKPGVSNLLEILAACERDQPDVAALRFDSYAELKEAVTQAIVDITRPLQERHARLVAEEGYLESVRREGAARCRDRASQTVQRAKFAIGMAT